jgi:glycosyltransferase involved in cell wall biosynthesis
MISISLCMIVKNEEEVLERCLQSVLKLVDEIIIVDTGSTDATVEIAKKYTDHVYDIEWIDDFSKARNYSFSKATKDYILWLDADDVLLEVDQEKFLTIKNQLDSTIDIVSMYYNIAFDENGKPTYQYRRNRLVKRNKGYKWIGYVHEYLEVYGHTLFSEIAITHRKAEKEKPPNTRRNLEIYRKKQKQGKNFSVRDKYYFANELRENQEYEEAIVLYEECIECEEAWVEDRINACQYLSWCYNQIGRHKEAFNSLLKSLELGEPKPKTACLIGDYLLENGKIHAALFWYNTAINFTRKKEDMSFFEAIYNTWYPHLQLCLCYWKLGNVEKAIDHNNRAGLHSPNHPKVMYNEDFFKSLNKNN